MSDVGPDFDRPVWAEGEAVPTGGHRRADMRMATPGFFETLGAQLRRGRDFDARDGADSPPVAIVNGALAEQLWPGRDPIGQRLLVDVGGTMDYEVIGLISDFRRRGLGEPPRRELYVPHAQRPYLIMNVAIRVDGPVASWLPLIRSAILELDPSQPAHSVSALGDLVAGSVARQRATSTLISWLGAVALLLAALGVYGALAMWVGERRREIGIRMALGAAPGHISRRVLALAMGMVGTGMALGGVLAVAAGRLIEGLLFRIEPLDPAAFTIAFFALLAAGLAASALPLRRATGTDPARCLREP